MNFDIQLFDNLHITGGVSANSFTLFEFTLFEIDDYTGLLTVVWVRFGIVGFSITWVYPGDTEREL